MCQLKTLKEEGNLRADNTQAVVPFLLQDRHPQTQEYTGNAARNSLFIYFSSAHYMSIYLLAGIIDYGSALPQRRIVNMSWKGQASSWDGKRGPKRLPGQAGQNVGAVAGPAPDRRMRRPSAS